MLIGIDHGRDRFGRNICGMGLRPPVYFFQAPSQFHPISFTSTMRAVDRMYSQQRQQAASQLHVYLAGDSVRSHCRTFWLTLASGGRELIFEAAGLLCHTCRACRCCFAKNFVKYGSGGVGLPGKFVRRLCRTFFCGLANRSGAICS
jgi:hypothetical protein